MQRGPWRTEAHARSSLMLIGVLSLALSSCGRLPTTQEANDAVLTLRQHESWARQCHALTVASVTFNTKKRNTETQVGTAMNLEVVSARTSSKAGSRPGSSITRSGNSCFRVVGQNGATGRTKTSENDQGLASSTKRNPSMSSPAFGRPVAT
jgi:hypothetical protein